MALNDYEAMTECARPYLSKTPEIFVIPSILVSFGNSIPCNALLFFSFKLPPMLTSSGRIKVSIFGLFRMPADPAVVRFGREMAFMLFPSRSRNPETVCRDSMDIEEQFITVIFPAFVRFGSSRFRLGMAAMFRLAIPPIERLRWPKRLLPNILTEVEVVLLDPACTKFGIDVNAVLAM